MNRPATPRLAGAKLLSTFMVAQHLPGFRPSEGMNRAVDNVIDYIHFHHPNSPTGRAWEKFRDPIIGMVNPRIIRRSTLRTGERTA